MTRDETRNIVRYLIGCYPNWKPEDLKETVDMWYFTLAEYDYREISVAAKIYVQTDTSGFAPSIGKLIDKAQTAKTQELTETEAWEITVKAISNSLYHSEEEYEKLPKACQKAIGGAYNMREIAQMDPETVSSVEKSHFLRNYRIACQRIRDDEKISENIRLAIEKMKVPEIDPPKPKPEIEEKSDKNKAPAWIDDAIDDLIGALH